MTTTRYCTLCKKMTVYILDKRVGHSFCSKCNSSSQFARMKKPIRDKIKDKVPFNLKKHKEIIYTIDGEEIIGKICKGKIYYDKGLEGWCCDKCDMTTTLK